MNKDIDEILELRPGSPNDLNFIIATWKRGFYFGNFWFKDIDEDAFMERYSQIIIELLNAKNSFVKVASLKEDPEIILGYTVLGYGFSKPIIHWVYVKEGWRKLGIAKRLVPEDADTATHMTAIGWKLKPNHMKFNPYKAFFEAKRENKWQT